MKTLALLLAFSLLGAAALASVTTTPLPARFEVHNADDSFEMCAGKQCPAPKDEAECLARAGALVSGKCIIRKNFKTVATCADEKAPTITLVQVDHEGGKYWQLPEEGAFAPPAPSESNNWAVMRWLYVPNPAGDAAYPNCWVRGWAPESAWRLNPNYPNTPIMELVVPGMADISEPPNSIEPVCKPDGPADCPV